MNASSGWNWTAIGVIISMCAIIITLAGLITTWRKILSDSKYQRSLLCLEQIKSYFANAASLLSARENNNVKWHQAIEILKMTDELKRYLTDISHQHVYVVEYMITAFSIIDIIKDMSDTIKSRTLKVIYDYLNDFNEHNFKMKAEQPV